MRLFTQTFGAFIESTSYTQCVLKESVPPIFQSTEAFQTTMVGSKRTRSKTAAMAQFVTAQSYSSHDPVIDMAAPPPPTAMNPQQTLAVAPQQPPHVIGTTAPAFTVVVPSQAPFAEHGGTSHQGGLTTTTDFGPISEQLQAFSPLPPRSTHAPAYTSNETLARVQLGYTHFSPPDPQNQVDLNLRVDQLTQRMHDQNNLMRQLLNQINLTQNLGLRQQGEEKRMDECADRQFDGNQVGRVSRQGDGQQRDQLTDMSQASASHTQSRRSLPSRLNLRTNVRDRLGLRPNIHARLGPQGNVHERLGSQGGQTENHCNRDREERRSAARS
ncbi:unnamed protein product [Prunus armeniaca]